MTTKNITRKVCAEISNAAHRAAYAASSMFLEKHHIKQGRIENGFYIKHGYTNADGDVTPIAKLVVGAKLRNRKALPQVGALSINRLLRQSFVGNQAWLADDVQVSVKRFMEPVTNFLAQYEQNLDVFAGIRLNDFTHTNVLSIYIMLKDIEEDSKRFAWEITIDNHDLVEALNAKSMFRS